MENQQQESQTECEQSTPCSDISSESAGARFCAVAQTSEPMKPRHPRSLARLFFSSNTAMHFMWLNLGTLLISIGLHFFKFPNSFNTGGVSGLALVVAEWFPNMTPSGLMFWLNNILLVLGYLIFGRNFGFKTTYSSIAMSGMIGVLEHLCPMNGTLTNQPLLELFFAVLLPGFGAAILFNIKASNGGTDIVGMILKKYTSLNIGTALGLADLLVTLLSFLAFGPAVGLFSLLGLIIKSSVIDYVIQSLNLHKQYTIVTTHCEEVRTYITGKLGRSATIVEAKGAFTGQPKVMIVTVLKRSQGVSLQHYLHEIDPESFVYITNTSEIIGKGFAGVN